MSSADFGNLPHEYQHLLDLAKDNYDLDVIPLQELKGGRTGAFLYLVSASAGDPRKVEHLVLKFDQVNERAKQTEVERHRLAYSQAPAVFATQNMARLEYEIENQGAVALFYSVAGQSLQQFRTLASLERQSELETLFRSTNDYLLSEWNPESTIEQALHPQKILQRWLGYRLKPDGNIGTFLKDTCGIDPDTEGFLVQGQVYPNPLGYGLNTAFWQETRAIDVLMGFQHGDLNIGNILAKFAVDSGELEGYFLIDFALYKSQMPLLYDHCYLELSYLIRELERASFQKWATLVSHFSNRNVPNPKEVPVELAGACTVVGAGRNSFNRWIHDTHPSLTDDLWGQFWLAAVAAGLNFCNKSALSTEERLAGLIYSASHLKRYCTQFAVPLPVEVRLLYDGSAWGKVAPVNKSIPVRDFHPKNLPIQPTPFIGRLAELKAIKALLLRENVHLVTITGPGGTGKTSLALQVTADLVDQFDDRLYFIDLAPIKDPESVLAIIARTIGLRESSDRPLLDELKRQLHDQKMLLLLDNFEQVTSAAPKIGDLLQDCPHLTLLVTSREALHLRGEYVFPVPPLGLPKADLKHLSIELLTQSEAVQLFVDRARAVKPDFALTDENAAAVAEVCLRLDGLPLAIELATARISLFSPQALLERVGSRLKLLRGGARDLPERQQTLRDTIAWSYELLSVGEQRLFALLSVFSGCTLEGVERVTGMVKYMDETGIDILDGLASLVEKSLIRRVDLDTGELRLQMLETIREFSTERLEELPEFKDAARRAHAVYFADFTRLQWERLTGYAREAAITEMETDLENVRTAWRYWVVDGNLEQLHKLTDCLWLIYDARGWYQATVDLANDLLDVLASTPSAPERVQQEIMLRTSLARALLATKGYTPEVEQAYTRALELSQTAGEISQLYPVLRGLFSFYTLKGEFDKGIPIGKQILDLAEHNDDEYLRVEGHFVLGTSYAFTGNTNLGLEHLETGISTIAPDWHRSSRFRLGNYPGVAGYTASAMIYWGLGFPDRALERANQAVALAKKLNHPYSLAYTLFHTGFLHYWRREAESCLSFAQAALEVAEKHELQIWYAVGTCLYGAGIARMGRAKEGLTRIEHGMELYQGLKSPPIFWPLLRCLQAEACGLVGKPEQGLALLEELLTIPNQGYGRVLQVDFFQLKGNLLLMLYPEKPSEAEPWFQTAMEIAREEGATMKELRAVVSLYQLWQDSGKAKQGRELLSNIYAKFSEGFTTVDLVEAKALLTASS